LSVFTLRDGQQILWEPTTELLCSGCRGEVDIHTLRRGGQESVNFMFEQRHPAGGDGRKHGEYWYLHKRCAGLERYFISKGADIRWGWHSMTWVLGIDETFQDHFGNLAKFLYKHMPDGVYEHLYGQWKPALGQQTKALPFKRQKPDPAVNKSYAIIPGYVYLIEAEGSGRIKIGRSFSAMIRLDTLATASPFPLKLLRRIETENASGLERALHRRYAKYKVHREWFALPPEVLTTLLTEDFS
jgi:Meiotically up-regulated gene 113